MVFRRVEGLFVVVGRVEGLFVVGMPGVREGGIRERGSRQQPWEESGRRSEGRHHLNGAGHRGAP